MKKVRKSLLILFIAVIILSLCACGKNALGTNNNNEDDISSSGSEGSSEQSSVSNERISHDEDGYYDDVGYYWLNDNSGYYDNKGVFFSTSGEGNSEQTDNNNGTSFPDEMLGTYGQAMIEYATGKDGSIIIEKDQIKILYGGQEVLLPAADFIQTDVSENGTLYECYGSGTQGYDAQLSVMKGFDDKTGDRLSSCEFAEITLFGADQKIETGAREKTKVLYGIPTGEYESLDDKGEFGILPMTQSVRNLILEGVSDDFIITYDDRNQDYSNYYISWYDEKGKRIGSRDIFEYKSEAAISQEDVDFYRQMGDIANEGNVVSITYKKNEDSMRYSFRDTKQSDLSDIDLIYGEKCFYDTYLRTLLHYVSKPLSVEEGKQINATTCIIDKMYAYRCENSDGTQIVNVVGTGMEPSIFIIDNNQGINYELHYARANGDTLLAYGYYEDYPNHEKDTTCVGEFTKDGENLTVKYYIYDGGGEITYDNYQEHTAKNEYTMTVTLAQEE